MPDFAKPVVGSFCWVEANVPDPNVAKGFYGELFGWKGQDVPMPQGSYTLFFLGEAQVAGLTQLPEKAKKAGTPPHWLSYVAVVDAHAAVKKAESLGGKVLLPPVAMGVGHMAVIQDPTGGALGLWGSTESEGSFRWGETNSLCWNELVSSDAPAAKKFYQALFGWKSESFPLGELEYAVLSNGEQQIAGIMQQPKDMAGMSSAWSAYFDVADCDAAAKKAERIGAKVLMPPTDIPDIGRFALLMDPQGAVFAVIKNAPKS